MDLEIAGNSALVTASSSGLGKASAKALAREGANVVINGRDEERLAEAKSEVESVAAGEVVAQPGDLTEPEDVAALVEATVDEFGGLDHLVTSAGGPPSVPFLDTTDEDWYEAYDLLVMSVVRLVREAAPHLQDGGGTIVNVTSNGEAKIPEDIRDKLHIDTPGRVRFVENDSFAKVGELTVGAGETETRDVGLPTYGADPDDLTVQLRIDGQIVAERPAT